MRLASLPAPNALQSLAPDVRAPDAEDAAEGAEELDPVLAAKLWRNPCWLSFRVNYLALVYNRPLYDWVRRRFGLSRPEFAVIYTLGLSDGALARDVGASYGFPATTLSRATRRLIRLGVISVARDPEDGRNRRLHLTAAGHAILAESTPRFVEGEAPFLDALDAEERATLSRLLAKVVIAATRRGAPAMDDEAAEAAGETDREREVD